MVLRLSKGFVKYNNHPVTNVIYKSYMFELSRSSWRLLCSRY